MPTPIPLDVNPTYGFLNDQIALLGSREPIDVLAETSESLEDIVAQHSIEELQRRTNESWTGVEILVHLTDMEWIFGFRARTILCDDNPRLPEIDQNAWVSVQRPNDWPPEQVIVDFRALRGVNLQMWKRMTESDLERTGEHVGAGMTISLGTLLRVHAGHDLRHLSQLHTALGQ